MCFLLLSVYCALIFAASMLGGRVSTLLRMTHLRTQLMISGVGGLMLGIAMLHLFPHAVESLGSSSQAGGLALIGLAAMFLLIRWFIPTITGSSKQRSPRLQGPRITRITTTTNITITTTTQHTLAIIRTAIPRWGSGGRGCISVAAAHSGRRRRAGVERDRRK